MRNQLFALLATLALMIGSSATFAAETNSAGDDLKALVGKINEKLRQQKSSEADLADEIKEFDALMAKHKEADPEARAQILFFKGAVYLEVLRQPTKTFSIFQQLTNDFPKTAIAQNAGSALGTLARQVEAERMQASLVAGAEFPGFDEKDLAGKPLTVAGYKGKVVLVDFWATWCMPCVMELPHVIDAYRKYHDQGFEIIGVSLDEDKPRLESFIKERKMTWQQYFDGQKWQNKLAGKYGVMAIPKTYLLDRDGKIIAADLRGDDLDKAVAAALQKK